MTIAFTHPAYYDPTVSPPVLIDLPPTMWNPTRIGKIQESITHETNAGVKYVYPLSERRVFELTWRFPESDYGEFQTYHDRMNGDEIPFIFVIDTGESPPRTAYVRKEKDFLPVPVSPGMNQVTLQMEQWYDYTTRLEEEIDTTALTV